MELAEVFWDVTTSSSRSLCSALPWRSRPRANLAGDQEADRTAGQDGARSARRQGGRPSRGGGTGRRHGDRAARRQDPGRWAGDRGRECRRRVDDHGRVDADREAGGRRGDRRHAQQDWQFSSSRRPRSARIPRLPTSSDGQGRTGLEGADSARGRYGLGLFRPGRHDPGGSRLRRLVRLSGPSPVSIYATIVLVTTLIIACPCALGLATPTSLTVGIGKGAENGILIRSGDALQSRRKARRHHPRQDGNDHPWRAIADRCRGRTRPSRDATVLRLAASLERGSEHPLGEAIVKGAEARKIALAEAEGFAAIPGHGVSGRIDEP